ncbi:MAG: ABC transporter permease [Vampirovibrionales bacterium]
MGFFLLRRLLSALPTLLCISLLGFGLMRLNLTLPAVVLPAIAGQHATTILPALTLKQPIDPLAALRTNPQMSASAIKQEEERLGLNQPIHVQYLRWLSHLLRLDLGQSFNGEEVFWLLQERVGNTLILNLCVLLVSWLLALPLGLLTTWAVGSWWDEAFTLTGSVLMAVPSFTLALIGLLVAAQTGWLPIGGIETEGLSYSLRHASGWVQWWSLTLDRAWHLILPVTVLSLGSIAGLQRQLRASLLEVTQTSCIRNTYARGLPPRRIWLKHVLRLGLNPMATLLGYEFAGLLAGSILTETVLQYPGLGLLTYEAILRTDTNLVMASLMLSALMLLMGNILSDILLRWLDPRVSESIQ